MRLIPFLLILAATAVYAQTASLPPSTQTVANPKTQKPDDPFGKTPSKSKAARAALNKNSKAKMPVDPLEKNQGKESISKSMSKASAKRPPDPLEKTQGKATKLKSMKKANAKAQMPPDPIEKNKHMK